ncbi:MAG: DmsE family decaheme c-type cytochrome [Desulfobulbaceae bacterium]|nr:DmsE family decaheme c-type cytochrome [Desulfobulbaceae bacterium]
MVSKIHLMKGLLLCGLLATFCISGCSRKLKEDNPIIPIMEYEKMLLGKLTSDYIGMENCLKGCHDHDKKALDFKSSTMGDQLEQSSHGMRVVDCESCHGPGSELMDTLEDLGPKKTPQEVIEAHKNTLIDYSSLPAGAFSLICLKCHTTNATFNIHNWNVGVHAANEVSCSSCHPIHAGADLMTQPRAITNLCLSCHVDISAQYSLPSHHPLKEGKMYCTDCHNPHGTANPKQLNEVTEKETCGRCHTEKSGPFLFEHGDVMEKCSACHAPHGSINNNLLKLREAFLCKQCHPRHSNTTLSTKSMFNTRCTDCHSMIHGSDTPGASAGPTSGGALTR